MAKRRRFTSDYPTGGQPETPSLGIRKPLFTVPIDPEISQTCRREKPSAKTPYKGGKAMHFSYFFLE